MWAVALSSPSPHDWPQRWCCRGWSQRQTLIFEKNVHWGPAIWPPVETWNDLKLCKHHVHLCVTEELTSAGPLPPPNRLTFICVVCPIMSGLSLKLVIITSVICCTLCMSLHLNEAPYMLLCLNEWKASLRCFPPFCSGRNCSIHHHQYAPLGTGATCCVTLPFQKRLNRWRI